MPPDAGAGWRVGWGMKFLDHRPRRGFWMRGWRVFVGPAVRSKDPEELKAAIERIPLPERRVAWRKAIYGLFGDDEMKESQRRDVAGIGMLEKALPKRAWLASERYSLADGNGFNLAYALPLAHPSLANDTLTPTII